MMVKGGNLLGLQESVWDLASLVFKIPFEIGCEY